jgi:opacity protein-like surface antigen
MASLLNFMVDLKNSTQFTPYVGLGLGSTRASLEN